MKYEKDIKDYLFAFNSSSFVKNNNRIFTFFKILIYLTLNRLDYNFKIKFKIDEWLN